jgi:hypothetical protein
MIMILMFSPKKNSAKFPVNPMSTGGLDCVHGRKLLFIHVRGIHTSRWNRKNVEFVRKKHYILIKSYLPTKPIICFKMTLCDMNYFDYFMVKSC